MQHLFTPEGDAALAAVVRRRPLLVFDFDGTLAPIVSRPEDARLSPAVAGQLAALARQLPLAILTGRQFADVSSRLGFEPTYVVGGHGAEDEHGVAFSQPMHDAMQRQRVRIEQCRSALHEAGVSVEEKCSSIALHLRTAPDHDHALAAIATTLSSLDDKLRVFGGNMVVNIVHRDAPDKADAVRSLLARCGATSVLFAGDDVNDEPVFEAARADWLTIRVGSPGVFSRAQYSLESPDEVAALLERIAALLQPD